MVKIHDSSVSAGVRLFRSGKHPDKKIFTPILRLMYGVRKPRNLLLGHKFAGVVEAAGKELSRFKVGDSVFGTTTGLKTGAYSQYICIPEVSKSAVLVKKPKNMTFEEAAVVPIGGLTALYFLRKSDIKPGQKVLIYGASGTNGTFAVQLAKHFGAEVTGLCSMSNLEMVKSIGADKLIDYAKEDFTKGGEKYDYILDAVGKLIPLNVRKFSPMMENLLPCLKVFIKKKIKI